MIRSLGVIILLTLVIVALVPRPEGGSDQFAGYAEQADAAAAAAPYPIFAPQPLPDGWTVLRAGTALVTDDEVDEGDATQPGLPGLVWRVDMRTETGRYATLEQSEGGRGPLAHRARQQPTVAGQMSAGPGQWARHADGHLRSLVHIQSGVWTVLTGDASWDQLETLAAALRPVPSA